MTWPSLPGIVASSRASTYSRRRPRTSDRWGCGSVPPHRWVVADRVRLVDDQPPPHIEPGAGQAERECQDERQQGEGGRHRLADGRPVLPSERRCRIIPQPEATLDRGGRSPRWPGRCSEGGRESGRSHRLACGSTPVGRVTVLSGGRESLVRRWYHLLGTASFRSGGPERPARGRVDRVPAPDSGRAGGGPACRSRAGRRRRSPRCGSRRRRTHRGGRVGIQGGEVGRDVREGAGGLPGLSRRSPTADPRACQGGCRRVGRLGGGGHRDEPADSPPASRSRRSPRPPTRRGAQSVPLANASAIRRAASTAVRRLSRLRVPLGQLGEGFDPAGAAGGERHDRPERQDFQLVEREIGQSHGPLRGSGRWLG